MSSAPYTTSESHPESGHPAPVSREEFLRLYANVEDGYKYEWNKGAIEKFKSMNQQQAFIIKCLNRLFLNTKCFKEGGVLVQEGDMDTSPDQLRRPDLTIYTSEQIPRMRKGENQVAPWIGEVISDSDNINKVNEKLDEYFKAGVQTVWHIFPASKQVYVYTAPDVVKICRGKTICSGHPALPDFEISAEDLFE